MNKKLLTVFLAIVIVAVTLTAGVLIGKNLSKEDVTDIISTTSTETAAVVTTTAIETTTAPTTAVTTVATTAPTTAATTVPTTAAIAATTTAATTITTTMAPITESPVTEAETVDATTKKITEAYTAPPANKPPESRISSEKARKIALKNAGFSANDVFDLDIELDFERGSWIYEISFENSNKDYEYVIDAVNGKILHSHAERDD